MTNQAARRIEAADEDLEVMVNNKPIGAGLAVKVGENFGVRVTYVGDLLEGFAVRDPAFEEWLRDERQRYRELAIAALKKLVTCETGANALAVAQRLLALAPLQEDAHRTVMRLHAEAGARTPQ